MTESGSMGGLGLKLWSVNTDRMDDAAELVREGQLSYVELYVVPGSSSQCLRCWQKGNIPFILHAPHAYSGLNMSLRKYKEDAKELILEVEAYRTALNPNGVIFHPGMRGTVNETIRQLRSFKKVFPELFDIALIENNPKEGLNGEICVGASPEEIKQIMEETNLALCLDIGHAICFSAWANMNYENVLDDFATLHPRIYHLSDGDVRSRTDMHLRLGDGNFNLEKIIRRIPQESTITLETSGGSQLDTARLKKEIDLVNSYLKHENAFPYKQ